MGLGGVTVNPLDGNIGAASDAAGGVMAVVGPASQGDVDTVKIISKVSQALTEYGPEGPLLEGIVAALQQVDRVLAVRCAATGAAAAVGAATEALNGSTGTFALGGTPASRYDVVVEITTGGVAADARFRYSLDGGRTWVTNQTFASGVAKALGSTGVTFTGTDDGVNATSFIVGATISAQADPAVPSTVELVAAVQALIDQPILFEAVVVKGPTAAAAWTGLGALADTQSTDAANPRWFYVVMEPTWPDADDMSGWTTARLAEAISDERVCVSAVFGIYVDARTGREMARNLADVATARDMANPVQRSSGRVRDGELLGTLEVWPEDFLTYTASLDDGRFMAGRNYPSLAGVYVNKPTMMAAPGSDYSRVARRRVMDKACRLVYAAALQLVEDEVDTGAASMTSASERLNAPVRSMQTEGEIVSGRVLVDLEQDILTTETFEAEIRLVPRGYAHEVSVSIAFANPFAS